jgi:hypothetical protein
VIDILPDREKKTFEDWLKNHPGIEVVSRDRASAYAEAAQDGAPEAIQVADRYHLLVNLRDHLKSFLDHKRTSLPKVEREGLDAQVGNQQDNISVEAAALAVLMKPLAPEQEPEPPQDGSIASFVRDRKREKWFYRPSEVVLAKAAR